MAPATVHRLMQRLEPGLSESFKKFNGARGEDFIKGNLNPVIAGLMHHAEEEFWNVS